MPRRRTALIEGGRLRAYLYDTYTANREGGALDRLGAARSGYRSLPSVSASNLVVAAGELLDWRSCWPRRATASTSPTSPACTPASTRSPASSRSAPRAALIRDGELAEPVREFTIAGDLVAMLSAVSAAGSEARWVPFGGSVSTPPLLVGEMSISGS